MSTWICRQGANGYGQCEDEQLTDNEWDSLLVILHKYDLEIQIQEEDESGVNVGELDWYIRKALTQDLHTAGFQWVGEEDDD